MIARVAWVLLVGTLAACGSATVALRPDVAGRTLDPSALLALRSAAEPSPWLVRLAGGARAWALVEPGGRVHALPVNADEVARIAAGGVAMLGERRVRLLEPAGTTRWSVELDAPIVDAVGHGDLVVAVTAAGRESTIVALDGRTGTMRWHHTLTGRLGRPLSAERGIAIPWSHQAIVIVDPADGAITGRVELPGLDAILAGRDTVLVEAATSIVVTHGSVAPLERPWTASAAGAFATLREEVSTRLGDELFAARVPSPSGRRAGILVAFGADGRLAADRSVHLVFYRYVAELRADGSLRRLHAFDEDVVRAALDGDGLVVLDAAGRLWRIDAAGARSEALALGVRVTDAILPSSLASTTTDVPTAEETAPRDGWLRIAADPDDRLVPLRRLAVRALGALPDPSVTRDLVELAGAPLTPPAVRGAIETALATRSGDEVVLEERLGTHFDFLAGTSPPPLELLAPLAGARRATTLVPALVDHLFDPATGAADAVSIAQALTAIGGADALRALERYARLYHLDGGAPEPVATAVLGWTMLAPEAAPTIRALVGEAGAPPSLAAALAAALAARHATLDEEAPVTARLPERHPRSVLQAPFVEGAGAIRDCVRGAADHLPGLALLRFSFWLSVDGTVRAMEVLPTDAELRRCLDPWLATLRFDPIARSSQRAQIVVRFLAPRMEGADPDLPWWAPYALPPGDEADASRAPWWRHEHVTERAAAEPAVVPDGDFDRWWVPTDP